MQIIKRLVLKLLEFHDILHALLAKNTGCDQLVTFDHDYEEFINLRKI